MENKEIKNYETVFIIRGNYTKEEYQEALNKVKNYMKNLIEIEKIDEIGVKKLAYELQKQKEGYFVVVEFKALAENIKELERLYRINDDILKFIVVRKDD